MARPIKKEPDYVPLDTDLLSNRKIRQIKRKYGSDTFLLCIALLCDIYANGYYITAYKEERERAFLRKVFQQYLSLIHIFQSGPGCIEASGIPAPAPAYR